MFLKRKDKKECKKQGIIRSEHNGLDGTRETIVGPALRISGYAIIGATLHIRITAITICFQLGFSSVVLTPAIGFGPCRLHP